jgi:hypothetical protein
MLQIVNALRAKNPPSVTVGPPALRAAGDTTLQASQSEHDTAAEAAEANVGDALPVQQPEDSMPGAGSGSEVHVRSARTAKALVPMMAVFNEPFLCAAISDYLA